MVFVKKLCWTIKKMNETEIRQLFEEIDPEGKINTKTKDELIEAVKNIKENPPKDGDKQGEYNIGVLKDQLDNETDWRIKAKLAAKIISLNLE